MVRNTPITRLLIANRGEIAVRIARTAAEMGIATVAIHSQDEQASLHLRRADQAIPLPGRGVQAYLDQDAIIAAARRCGADAIHPGYGFLSENADFAGQVEAAGIRFIGPRPESLRLFGDKVAARGQAQKLGVPLVPGARLSGGAAAGLQEAQTFFDSLPTGAAVMIKAVAGGGGRGMRVVTNSKDIAGALERCRSEAKVAFDNAALYIEQYLPSARHLEVQIVGDGSGECLALGERECTLQRRHQKVVEVAPSPSITSELREQLIKHATSMAGSDKYRSLGTVEFLLDTDAGGSHNRLFFIETNPRIQVEHTVTEEVYGLDLVRLQLELAQGQSLAEVIPAPDRLHSRGYAMQLRINMERMDAEGNIHPASGLIDCYEAPTGAGIRVDGFACSGYRSSPSYDSLLAKLIVHSTGSDFVDVIRKAERALQEFRIEGIETNLPWLRALIARPELRENRITTRFIEQNAQALAKAALEMAPSLFFDTEESEAPPDSQSPRPGQALPQGSEGLYSSMQATVVAMEVEAGETVVRGQQLAVLEAMKMEHVITAPCSGVVNKVFAEPGETLMQGDLVLAIDPDSTTGDELSENRTIDLDVIRPDLQEVFDRRSCGLDENRPEAVRKRHQRGQQTARENLAQVCDEGTFVEYGEFAIAAQSQRRSLDDLLKNTTGDGMITGLGQVNGHLFGEEVARCAFGIGDYMVLAGTQGQRHHRRLDRLLSVASEWNIPLVFFAEGGGGRPGDTDRATYAGISNGTFTKFAELSGQVPMVGVVSGRCFAGNAAFLGCCDVIIADESSNIGMAGPAMIEGGGLGVYPPEAVGPIDVQSRNGVVDIRVANETEACAVARKYLSYFQGTLQDWKAPDQRILRHVVPENRLRVYSIHEAICTMADEDSVLELRRDFGVGIVTALVRIEGRPFGVMANNPKHLGGAIDADAADKASRFMQLCDAFDIPIISLCDCPGFMVGPEAEKTALVRHVCRMYVTARSVSVPIFGVVLRKCYGLGAMAMLGGGTYDNFFTVSWPSGEFGPMGLEGAVKLGYRRELEAVEDPDEKQALYQKLLNEMYQQGKAISVANTLEIDAVIDPVETRTWIARGISSVKLRKPLSGKKRPFVDTW